MREPVIAAIQMDVRQVEKTVRLARAETVLAEVAAGGARLALLPELFNTGYAYSPANYAAAEPPEGMTLTWMKTTARRLDLHLAGTFLLREGSEIYNAMFIVAPDGRCWRYDKRFPWAWERAYFRPGRGITVAQTDLGAIGMLVCWDMGHAGQWRAYGGQVDLLLVASSPPDVGRARIDFADGRQFELAQHGGLIARMRSDARRVFLEVPALQARWLGVPVVNTVACGEFRSSLPAARLSLLGFTSLVPGLIRYYSQAEQAEIRCSMVPATAIYDASGIPLARLGRADKEGWILAQVPRYNGRHKPFRPQPRMRLSPLIYFISDALLPLACRGLYRKKIS